MPRKLVTFVTPRTGQWVILSDLDKEVKAILYDPGKPEDNISSNDYKNRYHDDPMLEKNDDVSFLKVLVWPRGLALTKLRWNEFVTDVASAKLEEIVDRRTGLKKPKYVAFKTFLNSNLVIGTREEWVPYLNKVETHPAVVEITSKDAGSVEMVINIALEILHPILIKEVEDIIGYVNSFVIEAFRLWGANRTFEELREVCTTDKKENKDGEPETNVKAKTLHDEIFARLTPLNEKDFIEKGVWVNRVAVMAIAVADRSKDLLESEEEIAKKANEAKAAEHQLKIELLLNKAQEARNKTALKYSGAIVDQKIKLVEKTSAGVAAANAAWGGTNGLERLMIGGNQTAPVETYIQALEFSDDSPTTRQAPQQKKKGGQNV